MALSKDVLDKNWTDEELDALGMSGDPDDWTSEQYARLEGLYMGQHPEAKQPDAIKYQSAFDPASMSLLPDAQKWLDAIKMDSRGLDRFRDEALRTGPSTWARLQNQRQTEEEMNARDSAVRGIAGKRAEAFSQLAQRGGLDSGARERMARSSMKDSLDMQQDIARQGSLNRLQIASNDEQNRVQQLGMLPGMEVQALQPQMEKARLMGQARQFDIGNQVRENEGRNAFNMQQYQEQMKQWAAGRQAQATESAGK